MTVADISKLTLREKHELMAALWEDLYPMEDDTEISPEIHALLDEREARVARGEATLHNWDDVKHLIGKR